MEPTEEEVEDRLRELGMRLASPPSDVDELLLLLDQTEIYLSRVEQSPSTSMSDALRPSMNSLISKEFLNHPDADVKVFVAACINEIIRVTAPDAPYNDDLMKGIFAIIVDAFEKLDDMSSCSYSKRVSILEIMAKVCSCVVMLDLACDDLILRMFENFLKSIRPDHPINVFSSMEMIMTLILEESEDISQELLICLLSNVQKSKKDVMPVVRRLALKVISNCSTKLKPYILVAVQSMDTSLSDYSNIVAYICQDSSVALEKNEVEGNKLSERTVSEELPQESEKLDKPVSFLEEVGVFADKTRKVLSNGVMPLANENAVVEPISPESKPETSFSSEQCRNNVVPIGENNSLGFITEKPCNEQYFHYIEAKSSSVQLTDASDSSRVDGDKETSSPTSRRAGQKRQTKNLKFDGASDMVPETEVLLECEREAEFQPLEGLVADNKCVNSVASTCNSPGSGLPIRRRVINSQFSENRNSSRRPYPAAGQKKMSELTMVAKEGSATIASKHKDHCLVSILDGKPSHDSTAEVAVAGISDGMSLRKDKKETAILVADANTLEDQWKSNANMSKGIDVTDKNLSAEPCLKEMVASSKASKEENNDQNSWVKFAGGNLKTKRRRKSPRLHNTYAEVIGREIEVWWPDDKKFYKGVIDSFDPVTEKHRVVYDDGDVEFLFLRNERWNYVDSKNFERGQENDISSPEYSLQVPRMKRRATKKRGKLDSKSMDMPIQQSVVENENSTVKSRGRPRQITSELCTPESLVREETKVEEEPSHTNNSDNNISTKFISAGDGKLVIKFRGTRLKGGSFRRIPKDPQKDEGTDFESKCRKSIGESLNEEALKPTGNDDKGIKLESCQTNNSDDTVPDSTDQELKGKDTLKIDNLGSKSPKGRRRKSKETVTATDTNVSAIENLDGLSERSAAKMNKRLRK